MSAEIETAVKELLQVVSFDNEDERVQTMKMVSAVSRSVATVIRILHAANGITITNKVRLRMATHLCVYIVQLEAGLYVMKNESNLKERELDRNIALETFCNVMSQAIRRLSVDTIADMMSEEGE